MAAEDKDPLVQALPPATDYLTYLTLLEYQLTPSRLPTLHRLLQDEVLTTNIGWDLVQILLPMLPASADCLHDVARLGNPREVILRVSDCLMKLESEEVQHDTDDERDEPSETTAEDNTSTELRRRVPLHITQFNCLVRMLSVLHRRIKTKAPSRFIAASLQAVLEAYSLIPTSETTLVLLEFLRDLSPSKRPVLPPRRKSTSSSGPRESQACAPDPEAAYDEATASDDIAVQQKLIQFGLIETLKIYLISVSSLQDPGLSLALRIIEQTDRHNRELPRELKSKTQMYSEVDYLKERDAIVGRICSLSRDLGLKDEELLRLILGPANSHPLPLDFEDIPKTADEIPLEIHGALILLAARYSAVYLFADSKKPVEISVYPGLSRIMQNFVDSDATDQSINEETQTLHDALLALTVISSQNKIEQPAAESEFRSLVLAVTKCSHRQSYNGLRNIPAIIFHGNTSDVARYKLIDHIFREEELLYARESAIGWLKAEIFQAMKTQDKSNIFICPSEFAKLSTTIYSASVFESLDLSAGIAVSWIGFSQDLAPYFHSALNLYYMILSSPQVREQLQLETNYKSFKKDFLEPLKKLCRAFEYDSAQNGGQGRIESVVGKDMCQIGMAQSVGLLLHMIEKLESKIGDVVKDDAVTT